MDLNNRYSKLSTDFVGFDKNNQAFVNSFNKTTDEFKSQINKLNTDLVTQKNTLGTLDKTTGTISTTSNKIQAEVSGLSKTNVDILSTLSSVNQFIQDQKNTNTSDNTTISSITKSIDTITTDLKTLKSQTSNDIMLKKIDGLSNDILAIKNILTPQNANAISALTRVVKNVEEAKTIQTSLNQINLSAVLGIRKDPDTIVNGISVKGTKCHILDVNGKDHTWQCE